ncbi:phage antirepressor [Bacillus sp. ISL-7]|uniref:phage antirepressor n=1 Tax=Bacillus sp. ISL-7 TaxID=2819136 RepID=UPI001BEA5577|nr:phage antirepressor [Bacillus sp. ISL-7]MBT2736594.1 phage antirepressor [Bacillus sp. ISL-7]
MTNELTILNFGLNEIRTVAIDGEVWFVAKDVTTVLDIKNPRTSLALLDEDEKGVHSMDTLGGKQELTIINEAGLYTLILKSRKPEAKAFKRWITHEVIPTIRQHGAYFTDNVLAKTLDDPNYMLGLLTNLAEERNKRILADHTIALQAPKVEAYDSFLSGLNTMTITEAGKCLGMSGIKLYEILRREGILLKSPYNAPAQEYLDKGYFKVILKRNDMPYPANVRQTRVTAAGVDFLFKILNRYGLIA